VFNVGDFYRNRFANPAKVKPKGFPSVSHIERLRRTDFDRVF